MDVIGALEQAAERGVSVCVIANARPAAPTKLPWRFWETNMAGYGEYRAAGYVVTVMDCDGDSSTWWISRHGNRIAEGADIYDGGDFYHFEAALLDAELVLRSLVRAQATQLKRRGHYPRSRWRT